MTIIERESAALFHTYKRLAIEIERGEGVYLRTKDGRLLLDMFSGLAVNALGYNHPAVHMAIQAQLKRYIHLSNYFYQETQVELAERLLKASGFNKVFLSNSGTEAMEGALKLARKWGKTRGKRSIFGLSGSFHGRTFGSLSITGREKYRDGYEPFLPNTCILNHNDVDQLERSVSEQTLAVVLECIQGEGGINPVSPEYIEALIALRRKLGFLIIADEIQSGIARTGKLFAFEHFGFKPDIVVTAKALGGGLPLGAFIAGEEFADVFAVGTHGTTFGGNPIACAAGIAVLKEVLDNGVMSNVEHVGACLKEKLRLIAEEKAERVRNIRGLGLMIGIEVTCDANRIAEEMLKKDVLVNITNGNVIRLLPPLILTNRESERFARLFSAVL